MTSADEIKAQAAECAARFGPRLKELRAKHGLTQAALAKAIGVSQARIAEYESATTNYTPTWETVIRLALLFDVSAEAFLREPQKIRNPD